MEDYATILLYFLGIKDCKRIVSMITCEFHIIIKVPCNILLSTNILDLKGFIIDCGRRITTLTSCRSMKVPLRLYKDAVSIMQLHVITTKKSITIPPCTSMAVPINKVGLLSVSIDYRFSAHYTKDILPLAMQEHFSKAVFDRDSATILYYNTSIVPMKILKNTTVGNVLL